MPITANARRSVKLEIARLAAVMVAAMAMPDPSIRTSTVSQSPSPSGPEPSTV